MRDRAFKVRGNTAKIIDIHCKHCDSVQLRYQKDGTGGLLRCYLNRIVEEVDGIIEKTAQGGKLTCGTCRQVLGTPMVHTDRRPAIRLRPGYTYKRLSAFDNTYT